MNVKRKNKGKSRRNLVFLGFNFFFWLRHCKRNFRWPFIFRGACPIDNGTIMSDSQWYLYVRFTMVPLKTLSDKVRIHAFAFKIWFNFHLLFLIEKLLVNFCFRNNGESYRIKYFLSYKNNVIFPIIDWGSNQLLLQEWFYWFILIIATGMHNPKTIPMVIPSSPIKMSAGQLFQGFMSYDWTIK